MKYFTLSHVLSARQYVLLTTVKDGKAIRKGKWLEKGKTYELGDYDEEKLLAQTTRVAYNTKSETYLKEEGVPFEVITCKVCGGKKKKIELPIAEVFESDPDKWEAVK